MYKGLEFQIKSALFSAETDVPQLQKLKFDLFGSAMNLKISASHQNLIRSASCPNVTGFFLSILGAWPDP